ncbi:MAG: RNA polymerase sigma factor [Sarcina sp.]
MLNQKKIKNIDAYIYTVLRNLKYLLYKKKIREQTLQKYHFAEDLKSEFHSNLEFFNLLNCLDNSDKNLLILRYLNNLTIREISSVTNIKKSTVDYRIKRAHRLIASRL